MGYMRPYLRRKEGRKKKKRKEKPWADARRKVRAFLSDFQPPTCLLPLEAEAISVCQGYFGAIWGWGSQPLGKSLNFLNQVRTGILLSIL